MGFTVIVKPFNFPYTHLLERICVSMLHLFISCSINYPLCAELILKQFRFNPSDFVFIIFSILHVNHISYCCMSCMFELGAFHNIYILNKSC